MPAEHCIKQINLEKKEGRQAVREEGFANSFLNLKSMNILLTDSDVDTFEKMFDEVMRKTT